MCYDSHNKAKKTEIIWDLGDIVVEDEPESFWSTHIMGHSHGFQPVIFRNRTDGLLHLKAMEWGVIPYYIKDEAAYAIQRNTMLNARSERILDDRSSYWHKIRNRRCLVPMTGTYEHRAIAGWKKKVPYFIKPKGLNTFYIPGLYSVAELPDRETGELLPRYTYTIITRAANSVMKQIHNAGTDTGRMPLFLPLDLCKEWLKEELNEDEYRKILNYEIPSEQLEYWPVFTIRSPKLRPDGLDKDAPYEWPALPALEVD